MTPEQIRVAAQNAKAPRNGFECQQLDKLHTHAVKAKMYDVALHLVKVMGLS